MIDLDFYCLACFCANEINAKQQTFTIGTDFDLIQMSINEKERGKKQTNKYEEDISTVLTNKELLLLFYFFLYEFSRLFCELLMTLDNVIEKKKNRQRKKSFHLLIR